MAERLRDSSQSRDSVDASFPSDKDIFTKAVCLFRDQETRECYDETVSSVTYVMILQILCDSLGGKQDLKIRVSTFL